MMVMQIHVAGFRVEARPFGAVEPARSRRPVLEPAAAWPARLWRPGPRAWSAGSGRTATRPPSDPDRATTTPPDGLAPSRAAVAKAGRPAVW